MDMQDKSMKKTSDLSQKAKDKISAGFNATKEKTENLSEQVKETASNLYQESKNKVNELEDAVCDYTEEFIHAIKEKPVKSILIASGVVYLLAKIFKH